MVGRARSHARAGCEVDDEQQGEPVTIEEQLRHHFGLGQVTCTRVNTLVNDVFEVTAPDGHFALKLYHPAWRTPGEVQWELEFVRHLLTQGVPVAKPVAGTDGGYLRDFTVAGHHRPIVLYEWAAGEKPRAGQETYVALGATAALIHQAADTFVSVSPRDRYDIPALVDDQMQLMKAPLEEAGQWQRAGQLAERVKNTVAALPLDWGVCHMDLTLDNIHRHGAGMTVFDFDSAGASYWAIEPYGVLLLSEAYFHDWLDGYRSIRRFSPADEEAVASFAIITEFGNVAWKLGLARSSRGKPLLQTADLPQVVDEWVTWEREHR